MFTFNKLGYIELLGDELELSRKVGSEVGLLVAKKEFAKSRQLALLDEDADTSEVAKELGGVPDHLSEAGATELKQTIEKYFYLLSYPSAPDYDDLVFLLHARSEIELCKGELSADEYNTVARLDSRLRKSCAKKAGDVNAARTMCIRAYSFFPDHLWWRPSEWHLQQ